MVDPKQISYLIFDTETNGINIGYNKPFMCQYMYVDKGLNEIEKGIFYFKHRNKDDEDREKIFKEVLKNVPTLVGANIKFDCNMLMNIGYPQELFETKNYVDVQVLARLCIDHDTQDSQAFQVALKKLSVRYLNKDANQEETILKRSLTTLKTAHKESMFKYLVGEGYFTDCKQDWLLFNKDIYGDEWFKNFHKYSNLVELRKQFLQSNPEPTYEDVPNINEYALTDVILTHGLFKLWYPKVLPLGQVPALTRTSKATFPLMIMEREGLVIDLKHLLSDREFMVKKYEALEQTLIDPRNGNRITVGQHEVLRQIYEYETGLKLSSSDKNVRAEIIDKSPTAKIVSELTSMEKLINTYASKLIREGRMIDGEFKVFTQYNLSSTLTGRLSSDFQQFPKEPTVIDGRTISVRDWFIKSKHTKYMVYEDYAQQELKLQCEWSGLVNNGQPDINMTRASEPYRCHKGDDGEWYLDEDPNTKWVPTDLHALTAKNAFPDIDETHPDWKHYRKLGKSTNFASNYGCSAPTLAKNIKVDLPTAQRLVQGYRNTFKGVVQYSKWIQSGVTYKQYFENLFHRRYYSHSAHKLQNWLVQGSGADILLIKLDELYQYTKTHPWWRLMISVHDEVGFAVDDIPLDQLVKEAHEVQEIMKVELNFVNVVTDIEVSDSTWGQKKELDEFLEAQH